MSLFRLNVANYFNDSKRTFCTLKTLMARNFIQFIYLGVKKRDNPNSAAAVADCPID